MTQTTVAILQKTPLGDAWLNALQELFDEAVRVARTLQSKHVETTASSKPEITNIACTQKRE